MIEEPPAKPAPLTIGHDADVEDVGFIDHPHQHRVTHRRHAIAHHPAAVTGRHGIGEITLRPGERVKHTIPGRQPTPDRTPASARSGNRQRSCRTTAGEALGRGHRHLVAHVERRSAPRRWSHHGQDAPQPVGPRSRRGAPARHRSPSGAHRPPAPGSRHRHEAEPKPNHSPSAGSRIARRRTSGRHALSQLAVATLVGGKMETSDIRASTATKIAPDSSAHWLAFPAYPPGSPACQRPSPAPAPRRRPAANR